MEIEILVLHGGTWLIVCKRNVELRAGGVFSSPCMYSNHS